jgi:hypothetical protein
MLKLNRRVTYVPLTLIALAAATFIFYAIAIDPATGETDRVSLSGVPEDALRSRGMELREATETEVQPVTKDHAEELAVAPPMNLSGGTPKIREILLVRLINKDAQLDRLAWAVNFEPSTIVTEEIGGAVFEKPPNADETRSPQPYVTEYAVRFIDAKTGEDIAYISMATQKGLPPAD